MGKLRRTGMCQIGLCVWAVALAALFPFIWQPNFIVQTSFLRLAEETVHTVAKRLLGQQIKATIIYMAFIEKELMNGNFFLSWMLRSAILLHTGDNFIRNAQIVFNKTNGADLEPEAYNAIKQHLYSARFLWTMQNSSIRKNYILLNC